MPVRKWSKQLPRQLIFMTTVKARANCNYPYWWWQNIFSTGQKQLISIARTLMTQILKYNFRWSDFQCGHRNRKQNSTCHGGSWQVEPVCHCPSSQDHPQCRSGDYCPQRWRGYWTWKSQLIKLRRFLLRTVSVNLSSNRKVVLIGQLFLIHKKYLSRSLKKTY